MAKYFGGGRMFTRFKSSTAKEVTPLSSAFPNLATLPKIVSSGYSNRGALAI
jgi:hypothetical protein